MTDEYAPDDLRGDSRVVRMCRSTASGREPQPYPWLPAVVQSDIQVWTDVDWPSLNATAAAARSSLPPHLVA